jgi:CheY-like chemotaxis protein
MAGAPWYAQFEMKRTKTKAIAERKQSSRAVRKLQHRFVTVLHIDDDPNDIELFQAATRKANVQFSVQNVTDGEQAMAYLSGRGIFGDRQRYPLPALILLDLKMPRATGFDVLGWIRNHPAVGNLPVVVFSGSELRDDMQQAYAGGADSYLVKPIGFSALVDLVKNIDADWIGGQVARTTHLAGHEPGCTWHHNTNWYDGANGAELRP